jgi:tetratricopeptide (TPR) repeat protein
MGFQLAGWKPCGTRALAAGLIAGVGWLGAAVSPAEAATPDGSGPRQVQFSTQQSQPSGYQSDGAAQYAPPPRRPPGAAQPNRRGGASSGQAAWPGGPIVRAAFARTNTAETEDDFTKILADCRRGLDMGLDGSMTVYTRRLMGWAHNRRGEVRTEADRQEEALEDFSAAVSLDDSKWRHFHNRGVSHATLGHYDKAIADFNQTLKMNPGYANAYFNRGELRYEQHDFVGAIGDYSQVIRLAPQDAGAFNSRGHAHYRLHEFREALADYHQAVRLDPENAAAYTNRGDMFADFGRWANASSDYRTAIKLNPRLGRAYQSAAWLMATCPDEVFRNPDEGLAAAEKAIELDGENDYRYLETLAAAEANAGQFSEAVETQHRAVALAPGDFRKHAEQRLNLYEHHTACREAPHTATPSTASRATRRPMPAPPR